MESRYMIGAMSGTSADGVDVALVRILSKGAEMGVALEKLHSRPYDPALQKAILDARSAGNTTLANFAWIAREVSLSYAAAVNELLLATGIPTNQISAVAAHGQTLFHKPPDTIQSLDPCLIAAETGCRIISDFRRADLAAGGQGAPLVPFADYCLFRHGSLHRAILNIGGIANLTFLPAGGQLNDLIAFDTGPGNCIIDYRVRLEDASRPWDADGAIAASGKEIPVLLQKILTAPFFAQPPPKSTDGPEMIQLFTSALAEMNQKFPPEDLLRTACALTAETITLAIRRLLKKPPSEVLVSGGGTKNKTLMDLLRQRLGNIPLCLTDDYGIVGSAKEAMAFALLGAATLDNLPSNVPAATGARKPVVLGTLTPPP